MEKFHPKELSLGRFLDARHIFVLVRALRQIDPLRCSNPMPPWSTAPAGFDCFPYEHPSDEAHFWLNGYVNKQNCRIWSEANPQVYVETPLHPEKLTVWCALWAGGILLQKR
ncbi:hypothetical protein TNCV_3660961 [Trichonephila clavipes]|nr:hypothetical protein TNCV_3660961 [Trichonephila clavipes]